MIQFLSPTDGDVLFEQADGKKVENGLAVEVRVSAPAGKTVLIAGKKAAETEGIYSAVTELQGDFAVIEAALAETGETRSIRLFRFPKTENAYYFAVDDVIFCLENIYRHRDVYTSLFEDPFLGMLRRLHRTHGTKVHLHLYYETVDGTFNLSMFPATYKREWEENAHWLRLTFHARCDAPDSPYKTAPYDLVLREGKEVIREIRRFAGDAVMDAATSEHWADSGREGTRAFRDLGYRVLDGYFLFDKEGKPYVSYYLDEKQTAHAHQRDFWVDTAENIIFVKDDIIINEVELENIEPAMEKLYAGKSHAFMYLLIHEQYFYDFFKHYEKDYEERILKAVGWCETHGYHSVFLADVLPPQKKSAGFPTTD